ncbi:hypothetical protein [uncultured Roseobacter sp.]|uniref:hypothetical protein n=1 Tax=uncultured Roseobacter sp. TaxID=114847 RepID=UPI0026300CE9|nr:hypothetical protein [uncultured Roseobacter sp.]
MENFLYSLRRFRLSYLFWVVFVTLALSFLAIQVLVQFNVVPVPILAAALGGLLLGVLIDIVTSFGSQDQWTKRLMHTLEEDEYHTSVQSLTSRYIGVVSEAAEWVCNTTFQNEYPTNGQRYLSQASDLARQIIGTEDLSEKDVLFVLETQNHLAKFVLMRGETEDGVAALLERMGSLALVGSLRTNSGVPENRKVLPVDTDA